MRLVLTKLFIGFSIVLLAVGSAAANFSDRALEKFLHEFHEDPASVMSRLPYEVGPDGEIIERGTIPEMESEEAEALLEQRRFSREWVVDRSVFANEPMIMAPPLERDYAQSVVHDKRIISNVFELHNNGWSSGEPGFVPWADSYWPRTRGIISHRYADPRMGNSTNWLTNHSFFKSNPPASYVPHSISQLSPAEKYDLLVGDRSWSLTHFGWEVGRQSQERWGRVPTWEGICHGWAAAAHMGVAPPQGPVTVKSIDGHSIQFRESDIKGLLSSLWAQVYVPTNYSGHVCRKESRAIERDEVGRVIDAECFDTNPASWHLLVTNQVGRLGKSFAMDVTWDSAIWNYSVAGYKATYFNPQSKRPTRSLEAAIIPIEDFRIDKFSRFRSPDTRYIVGVSMDVDHPESVQPTMGSHRDEPRMTTIRWVYDLELDRDYNIVGGEWYSTAHPDFLWSFDSDANPTSEADRKILGSEVLWQGDKIPAVWAEAARQSSVKGEPARLIVEKIRDRSRGIFEDSADENLEDIEDIEEPIEDGAGDREAEASVAP